MIISNTRVTAYNTCTMLDDFMYRQELEPRIKPIHITRGEVGHKILEVYYKARREGINHGEAAENVQSLILKFVTTADSTNFEYIEMLADLSILIRQYFSYYENDSFKIIAVEVPMVANLIDGVELGYIADLIIEVTSGPYRGELQIWDHKFLTNFKSDDELKLDGQQPRYLKAAQVTGWPVKRAIFNQIRTRKMKAPKPADLFRRSPLISPRQAIDTVWEETQIAAGEIVNRPRDVRRTLSYSACKRCFYQAPCIASMAGEPVETMLAANFKKRTRPFEKLALVNDV